MNDPPESHDARVTEISIRVHSRAGIAVCERVSDVVGAVDAPIKRADLN